MRIALVSINFSPEVTGIGPVVRGYANTLHEAGHDVVVVTGIPHYPEWRPRQADDSGIPYRVERCPHYVPRRSTALHRALYEVSFAFAAAWRLRSLRHLDVIVPVIPPLGAALLSLLWAARTGASCAPIVQDIVSAAAEETAMVGPIVAALVRIGEDATLKRCTRIGAINDAMVDALAARGIPRARIHLVPNWPLHDMPFPPHNQARAAIGYRDGEIVAVHSGNMGAKQGLDIVVAAARLAAARDLPVRFLLIGDGNRRATLEESSRGLSTLALWPLQPEEDYRRALAGADVLLLTQRSTVKDFAFPSKLISYVRAGRPIVASVAPDSAAGRTLARTGAALLIPPDDPAALLNGVVAVARDEPLRRRLVDAAGLYYRTELEPAALRASFRAFVEGSVAARRA